MLKMGDSAKVVIKQDMKGRRHKYGFTFSSLGLGVMVLGSRFRVGGYGFGLG